MITRKSKVVSSTAVWPYTPEPSPPQEAAPIRLAYHQDSTMSTEELPRARPISVIPKREGTLSPSGRPTLDDVLNGRAPAPYTLAAYTAFLSSQHCLETLEFVTEAKKYGAKYDESVATFAGMPFNTDSDEGYEVMQDWVRILDVYVKPGAPREINLPAEERDDLLEYPYEPKPPPPEALDPAVKRMYDLMSDSIFIPFCNSVRAMPHAQTYSAPSALSDYDSPRLTFSERYAASHGRQSSRRRRSPPATSGAPLEPQRSPPQQQQRSRATSALTSGLNRESSTRLSAHVSHSSAASDGALTDDSSVGHSNSRHENENFMSPPTTPPQSDLPFQSTSSRGPIQPSHISKPTKHDNGGSGWKKMGMKIFGNKKK